MMENRQKKKNKVSKRKDISYYLPPDIWTNSILPTLPVKTLLRCRSVCKLWCSTIDDPSFVSTHFKLSNNNRDKKYSLSIERLGYQGRKGCRLTLRHIETMRKTSPLFDSNLECYFQVACNGLIFVLPVDFMNVAMKIWNPSVRKSLSVPPCPLVTRHAHAYINYLFGFRPSSNDYVLFAFQDHMMSTQVSVAAYTLSDNLWRIRKNEMSLPRWFFTGFHYANQMIMCGNESVFLEGTLHWFGYDPNPDIDIKCGKNHLVSFDFDEEKFSYLELPDSFHAMMATRPYRNLFAFGGMLAICIISPQSSSIWVLKNKVWDRLFYGLSSSVGFDYIRKNPYVVTKLFCVKDGGITLVYGKVAYKFTNDEIKQLTKSLSPKPILDTYLESMVLHKGCPGQVLTSLKTPPKTTAVVIWYTDFSDSFDE